MAPFLAGRTVVNSGRDVVFGRNVANSGHDVVIAKRGRFWDAVLALSSCSAKPEITRKGHLDTLASTTRVDNLAKGSANMCDSRTATVAVAAQATRPITREIPSDYFMTTGRDGTGCEADQRILAVDDLIVFQHAAFGGSRALQLANTPRSNVNGTCIAIMTGATLAPTYRNDNNNSLAAFLLACKRDGPATQHPFQMLRLARQPWRHPHPHPHPHHHPHHHQHHHHHQHLIAAASSLTASHTAAATANNRCFHSWTCPFPPSIGTSSTSPVSATCSSNHHHHQPHNQHHHHHHQQQLHGAAHHGATTAALVSRYKQRLVQLSKPFVRTLFIQTQSTPNPASLMFLPGRPVLALPSTELDREVGDGSQPIITHQSPTSATTSSDREQAEGEASPFSSSSSSSSLPSTIEFASARSALDSPLAIALFRIDGVSRVLLGSNFVTVTKSQEASWDVLKPEVFASLMDFFLSSQPLLTPAALQRLAAATSQTGSQSSSDFPLADEGEEESETVLMIRELLETRIRPAVQEDGGDIDFVDFDEDSGVVRLRLRGACSGCPSSSVTLKSGVQNMLMHYIPEVTAVEELTEEEDEV